MEGAKEIVVRDLGLVDYQPVFNAMQRFSETRTDLQIDELWCLQHNPVYTLGRSGNRTNLLDVKDIPVIQVDRGGDVTFHGPGQLVIYLLADIKRLDKNVRQVVSAIEESIVEYLAGLGIESTARSDAPGVYVDGKKIASLGLRVRRGSTYHGLALNWDMDMSPWAGINACALGVPITQLSELLDNVPPISSVALELTKLLTDRLGYNYLLDAESELSYD